jgi:hypothetical protein
MNTYFVEVSGTGAEYTAGFVDDSWGMDYEDDEEGLADNLGEVVNFDGETKEYFEVDDIFHIHAAHYSESTFTVTDSNNEIIDELDMSDEEKSIQVGVLPYFQLEDTKSEYVLNVCSSDEGRWGKYELAVDEPYESKRLYVLTNDLEESVGGWATDVIESIIYVPKSVVDDESLETFIEDNLPSLLSDADKIGDAYAETRRSILQASGCIVLNQVEDFEIDNNGISASISHIEPSFDD